MAASFLAPFYLVCGIVMFLLAVTILRQSGRDAASWFTALVLTFASFGPILGALGYLLELEPREGAIVLENFVASFDYVWEFFFPSLLLFSFVYPRRSRAWRFIKRFLWILFVPHVFHLLIVILSLDRIDPAKFMRKFLPPAGSSGAAKLLIDRVIRFLDLPLGLLFRTHRELFSLVNITYAVAALLILYASTRSELPVRIRRQVKTLLLGLGICIITFACARFVPAFTATEYRQDVSTAFINAALIIGGGSIAYAIVRHQFLGLRVIARRGILYVAAAAISATAYLLIARQITSVFDRFSGGRSEILDMGFIVLFIIAFQPVLVRLEEWSDRSIVKEGRDARARLRELSGSLLTMIDEKELKEKVGSELREVFETNEAELALIRELEFEYAEDPELERAIAVVCRAAEPMIREDFLVSMDIRPSSGWFSKRGAKREFDALVERLSPGVRRLASYRLIVPVMHDIECVALMLLGDRREHDRYSAEEIALLSMLSSQIAASLHNIELLKEVVEKRVMEEELNIARSIQLSLLPSKAPKLDAYEIAAMSVSSKHVGGDYYDFLHREPHLAIAVADVAGKGVPASLLMAWLQASLRSNMDLMQSPADLVSRLNRMMCDSVSDDRFATLFYGCLDMNDHELSFTNAGHVFPCMVRSGGEIEILGYSGLILGIKPDYSYETRSIVFSIGDALVITSDGVTEASNEEEDYYGEERLRSLLSSCRGATALELRDSIVEDVKRFSGGKGARDDLTILVLKRKR